jgi:hypothetical protein
MRILRRHRFVAFFALVALLLTTTAYEAHGYTDKAGAHDGVRCNLCLQFSSPAGAPSETELTSRPPLVAEAAPLPTSPTLPARRRAGSQQPRAPPSQA